MLPMSWTLETLPIHPPLILLTLSNRQPLIDSSSSHSSTSPTGRRVNWTGKFGSLGSFWRLWYQGQGNDWGRIRGYPYGHTYYQLVVDLLELPMDIASVEVSQSSLSTCVHLLHVSLRLYRPRCLRLFQASNCFVLLHLVQSAQRHQR